MFGNRGHVRHVLIISARLTPQNHKRPQKKDPLQYLGYYTCVGVWKTIWPGKTTTRELLTVCGTLIMTGSHYYFLWSRMFEISKLNKMLEIPYLYTWILQMIKNKRKVKKTLSNLIFYQQDSCLSPISWKVLSHGSEVRAWPGKLRHVSSDVKELDCVDQLTSLRWLMPAVAINTAQLQSGSSIRLRSFKLRWKRSETEGSFNFYYEDTLNSYRRCDSSYFPTPWHSQRSCKTRPSSSPHRESKGWFDPGLTTERLEIFIICMYVPVLHLWCFLC